ncbi:Fic family protein [Helicobacter labacensis]|uniref:Fic family protein n=1 Tax=Helicobacter labacensis TaxID=2316079 RepID=UPI000EB3FA71|nr:DUF4172 domain-containing protein [Helicobacter labacensis]
MKRWIWENDFFEHLNFTYDPVDMSSLSKKIDGLNKVGSNDNIKVEILSDELIYSFLIESEVLNRDSVYSSVSKVFNLNVEQSYKWTEWGDNLAILLKEVREDFGQWNKERLLDYHRALFFNRPKSLMQRVNVGSYRGDLDGRMRIVSGHMGREKIHYIAPHASDLEKLMDNFYAYVNSEVLTKEDKIAHAFISHLIFVLIHPLDDGNGRIARIINDNLLAKTKLFNNDYFSVSTGVYLTRRDYYATLENICKQQHNNITKWVEYGVTSLEIGIDLLLKQIALIVIKTNIFDRLTPVLNENQVRIINKLFDRHLENSRGGNTSVALKIKRQEIDKDILHLKDLGVLKQVSNSSFKNLRFELDFSVF